MNSLTIEQLDELIQTRHPEEQKIKDLLDSPTEENQLLGLQLARSVLGWSFYDIGYYVLNSGKGWKRYEIFKGSTPSYNKCFLGVWLDYTLVININQGILIQWHQCEMLVKKTIFSGSELEKTKAETSEFIRKIYEENFQNIE